MTVFTFPPRAYVGVSLVHPYNPESTDFNINDASLAGLQGFNSNVEFIFLVTALIPFIFTNSHVNKPSDISV